jgi:hypothetical protein
MDKRGVQITAEMDINTKKKKTYSLSPSYTPELELLQGLHCQPVHRKLALKVLETQALRFFPKVPTDHDDHDLELLSHLFPEPYPCSTPPVSKSACHYGMIGDNAQLLK